jgi:mRNA-degrading endonuclease RelE of RelBE toxin-antitoxin system
MSFSILVTPSFEKEVKTLKKKYPSVNSDLAKLIAILEKDAFEGKPIGKDCYKIRMAITSKGKGKSGGARVITCVKVVNENVYLLSIYDKSDKEAIGDKELIMLLESAGLL